MGSIESKIAELGFAVPAVAKPVAAYIPAIQIGRLVTTSGQLPMVEGKLPKAGKLGAEVSIEEGAEFARTACLNALAAVKSVCGDLDKIQRIIRVVVFVQSTDDFTDQPKVANGASEFLGQVFGDAGAHIRSAVGTNSLPLGTPVELELTVELAQ